MPCEHLVRKCINSRKNVEDGIPYTRRRWLCDSCGAKISTVEVEVATQRGHTLLQSLRDQYGKRVGAYELRAAIKLLERLREGGPTNLPKSDVPEEEANRAIDAWLSPGKFKK